MIVWPHRAGLVETADRDLHTVVKDRFVHAERAAAMCAEAAFCIRRRAVSRRFSCGPREAGEGKVNEGPECSARYLAADAAMTIDEAHRIPARAVAHRTP